MVKAKKAQTRLGQPGYAIYVGALSKQETDSGLREMFTSFGRIIGAKVHKRNQSSEVNAGLVTFERADDALAAVISFQRESPALLVTLARSGPVPKSRTAAVADGAAQSLRRLPASPEVPFLHLKSTPVRQGAFLEALAAVLPRLKRKREDEDNKAKQLSAKRKREDENGKAKQSSKQSSTKRQQRDQSSEQARREGSWMLDFVPPPMGFFTLASPDQPLDQSDPHAQFLRTNKYGMGIDLF